LLSPSLYWVRGRNLKTKLSAWRNTTRGKKSGHFNCFWNSTLLVYSACVCVFSTLADLFDEMHQGKFCIQGTNPFFILVHSYLESSHLKGTHAKLCVLMKLMGFKFFNLMPFQPPFCIHLMLTALICSHSGSCFTIIHFNSIEKTKSC